MISSFLFSSLLFLFLFFSFLSELCFFAVNSSLFFRIFRMFLWLKSSSPCLRGEILTRLMI